MKRVLLALALLPLALWGAFNLPELLAGQPGFWSWRRAAIVLSGVLALWWMSCAMLLAMRPAWLERLGIGLDRVYRLHRRIGIGAGLLVLAHWMLEWLPKKLSRLGWLPPRGRGPKGDESFWIELAKDSGEWAAYLLLALVVVALVKWLPYRAFRAVHKAFGVIFIAGAFHGLMLLPRDDWQQPLAWLTLPLAVAASFAAVRALRGGIGRSRRHPARIEALRQPAAGVLEIVCRPADWPGHRAGQFLFLDGVRSAEGAHPFTIASAWQPASGTLTLAIKALGDFTARLPGLLRVGQQITLEGPYGCFDFAAGRGVDRDASPAPQIWVAGGIGVTPFLARLQQLADGGGAGGAVDFFYSTPQARADDFPAQLAALCQSAGVRLHRHASERDGPLSSAAIASRLQPASSVWFCGPAAWGETLRSQLTAHGLPRRAFHQEAFEFR